MHTPKYLARPSSLQEFELLSTYASQAEICTVCVDCKHPFTAANVFTRAGWRETQITGTCEQCFETYFSEGAEDV